MSKTCNTTPSVVLHLSIVSTNSGTFESHSCLMEKQIAQNIAFELLPHNTWSHTIKHNEQKKTKQMPTWLSRDSDHHRLNLNSKPAYCATGESSHWGSIWLFSDFGEIKVYNDSALVCLHWCTLKGWINMFQTHFIHPTRHQFYSF